MLFVGDDWAEDHHDVYLMDDGGARVAARRLPEGVASIAALHELIAAHAEEPGDVVVGIETDRGLWVKRLTGSRLSGVRYQSDGGGPLPRPASGLGSEIRCRRCEAVG
jgi:Transposase